MYYFQTTVTYNKEIGDGKLKKSKEQYLSKALNYADAEEKMTEYISHYSHDGLPDVEIKRVHFMDIFQNDDAAADKWYKVKVEFIALDGEGENLRERKVAHVFLVQAADNTAAIKQLEKNLEGSDYSVQTVTETKIIDYLNFVDSGEDAAK